MTVYQKLTVFLKGGGMLVSRHPSVDMDFFIRQAKDRQDYLEHRVELA
jgi:hypothetical protein